MPNPGQINNAQGVNGLYEPSHPYGDIKRLQQMTQVAPIDRPRALSAPKRAQRKATTPASQKPPPYEEELATAFMEIASLPGASPLVQEYALRAQRGPR